mgnify:CR=1 FL=1
MRSRLVSRPAAALMLALAALVAGCATNPVTHKRELVLVTPAQEAALGREGHTATLAEYGAYDDAALAAYVDSVGRRVARASDQPGLPWRFTILDDAVVNAFALPGGYIYVTRGLLAHLQSEAQLAGVLGHEIGHVTRRHSIKQMQKAQGANVGVTLACVLTGICNNGLANAGIQIAAGGVFAKFSRDDEAEADREGVKTVIRAGIDPTGIPEMFRILLDERKARPGGVDQFFLSHPLEESRIAATQSMIGTYPPDVVRGLTKDSPNFQAFKKRLQSLPPSPPSKR